MSYSSTVIQLTEDLMDNPAEPEADTGTSTFILRGSGNGVFSTPTSREIDNVLSAKGFLSGREYLWQGPWQLKIRNSALDADVINILGLQSAYQVA